MSDNNSIIDSMESRPALEAGFWYKCRSVGVKILVLETPTKSNDNKYLVYHRYRSHHGGYHAVYSRHRIDGNHGWEKC